MAAGFSTWLSRRFPVATSRGMDTKEVMARFEAERVSKEGQAPSILVPAALIWKLVPGSVSAWRGQGVLKEVLRP